MFEFLLIFCIFSIFLFFLLIGGFSNLFFSFFPFLSSSFFFMFSCFSVLHFFFSFVFSFFTFSLFKIFQSSEHTPKPEKNRRTVPIVKMTISLCSKFDFWVSMDNGGGELGMGHLRLTPLSCFSFFSPSSSHFCFFKEKCFFFFRFSVFFKCFIAGISIRI